MGRITGHVIDEFIPKPLSIDGLVLSRRTSLTPPSNEINQVIATDENVWNESATNSLGLKEYQMNVF